MFCNCTIGVAPKEGCDLPPAEEIGGDLFDILREQTVHDAAYDFTVVTLAIRQVAADAAVPDGEDPLNWLRMSIQGYDYLLADPQPGLATWHEARDRGLRRIVAACLALIEAESRT